MPRNIGQETLINQAVTADENFEFEVPSVAQGGRFWLEVVWDGADVDETLNIKFQTKSPGGAFHDLPDAAFAQVANANSNQSLLIHPDLAETANQTVSAILSRHMRVVADVGGTTPAYTVVLYVEWLA